MRQTARQAARPASISESSARFPAARLAAAWGARCRLQLGATFSPSTSQCVFQHFVRRHKSGPKTHQLPKSGHPSTRSSSRVIARGCDTPAVPAPSPTTPPPVAPQPPSGVSSGWTGPETLPAVIPLAVSPQGGFANTPQPLHGEARMVCAPRPPDSSVRRKEIKQCRQLELTGGTPLRSRRSGCSRFSHVYCEKRNRKKVNFLHEC